MSDELKHEHEKDELLKLFEKSERSYLKRLADMCVGFSKPKDSVEFKEACIELQRLWAPIVAISLPVFVLIIMCMVKIGGEVKEVTVEMQVIEAEETQELVEEEPPPPEEPPELEETPLEIDSPVVEMDAPPTTSAEQSPQPADLDTVAMTPSPVVMKGVMTSRNPGLRGAKIGKYGAGATEKYVVGFLRFMAMKQKPNGSWADSTGETALALLTFLAHGDTPSQSEEFGQVVEKAIRWLLDDQISSESELKEILSKHPDRAKWPASGGQHSFRRDEVGYFFHRDSCNYAHMVATYALAEAYAMTRIPDIKDALEKAVPVITKGQNANGGWYYNFDPKCPITDSSFVSWAVQALKACKIAGIHDPGIVTALKKSVKGIKETRNPANGAFGYLNTQKTAYSGLTAPAALILQMLDEGDTPDARKAIEFMDAWEPTFAREFKPGRGNPMGGKSPQYYCYYLSQVRFNLGDNNAAWKRWNAQQLKLYTAAGIVVPADKSGYKDPKGKPQYVSYWGITKDKHKWGEKDTAMTDLERLTKDSATKGGMRNGIPVKDLICNDAASVEWWGPGAYSQKKDGSSHVLGGCFTALQLMVYYRNSPLAKGALTKIEEEAKMEVEDDSGVTIDGLDDL